MKFVWQSLVAFLFIIVLLLVQITYWINPLNLSDVIIIRAELLHFVHQYPVLSSSIYIFSYTLSIIFGIPISATIIGGYLFGILHGILYSMISVVLGTIILCSLVRYAFGDLLQKRYKKQLEPFNKELEKYGLHYIVIVHVIPFMPSFLPHIATGISAIPLYTIIGINIIGALPLTCLYVIGGASLHYLHSLKEFIFFVGIFGLILGLLFLAAMLYRRWLT